MKEEFEKEDRRFREELKKAAEKGKEQEVIARQRERYRALFQKLQRRDREHKL